MDETSLAILGISAFFLSYAIFLLVAYKRDPRYQLKYERNQSFYKIAGLSVLNRVILLSLLLMFTMLANRQPEEVFSFRGYNATIETVLGVLAGFLIFFLGVAVNMLIQIFRLKFSRGSTLREREVLKITLGTKPMAFTDFIMVLSVTTLFSGILEEIVFRGYLLNHLLLLVHPSIAILVQAFLYFIPDLYRGTYGALLTLYRGIMFGVFFFLAGSLLTAIIAHLISDLAGLYVEAKSIRKILVKQVKD